MKRKTLKLFALLLAAIMVLILVPATALAERRIDRPGSIDITPPTNGYRRSPEHGTRAVSDAYVRGDMETYYRLSGKTATRATLPSSYDSRNYNIVTSVKNQNPYGSCWAHAAMASVESYMIKYEVPVGTGAAATTSLNLSETQHCFFNYTSAYDAEGMLTGDKSTSDDGCLDQGGNGEMSAYTLMRWTGAASESVEALQYSRASTVASSGLSSQYAYGSNVCHVQNSVWIPATDIDAVKEAIMKYGAGNISYYAGNSTPTYNCTIDTSSQSSSSHKWANHAITLIGWDDSIAASKFSPNKPSGNGGWLCKNSWGTSYFDQGYMWISYEDTSVLEGYIYFYDAEPIDNYDHNYQYDGSCNVVCYGKGWNNSIAYYEGFANNTKVANVFTAKGSELLQAVAYCNWDEALTYTIEIYKNPTAGNPSSGTLMATETGTLVFSGYYTIPLTNPVPLAAGDTFSVVVTQNVPEADDNGKYVHTPYDATFNNSSVVDWCSWTHANHGATSYYKEPNGSWTDCPDNGDYRIKAFTDDLTFTVTAVSNNTNYGTVSVAGTKITASPKTGYYVSGYEVISGTATATINGNIINVAPESDCTIRVIFAPKPTYTVTYVSAGASAGSVSAQIYDAITLPATVNNVPDGWTFLGWTEAQVAETAAAPAFHAPGAEYTVTNNVTLYALFTRTEGTGDLIYRLVNDNLSDWTGNYIITCGKDAGALVLKGISGNTSYESSSAGGAAAFSNTGMTLDGEVIRNANNAYVFGIAPVGSSYTIRNASTGTYMGSYNSYLYSRSSYESNYCNWSVEYDLYNICMKVSNSASSSYPYMVKGSNSYFVVNSGYTTNKTQFWKEEVEGVTYYNTDPVAPHTHAYGAWTSNNDGTHSKTCADCGDKVTENCTYHDVVTAPTATAQGYTTHTCTVCGYSFVDSYVDPLGYTVAFSVPAGVAAPAPVNAQAGASITLPTAVAPAGYEFLGWVTQDYTNVTTLPNVLTGSYTVNADITLKALYSHTDTVAGGFELLTEAPENWEGSYVITYGNGADATVLKGLSGTKKYESATAGGAAALAGTGIVRNGTTLTDVADAYIFRITAVGGKFSVKNAATGTYLASKGSYLYSYKTDTASYCRWAFAMNGAAVDATNAASRTNTHLSFHTKGYFMVGRAANENVFFWKSTGDTTATVYTTEIN
ncbi:MAG: InlB B-repeat-containing protein [Clostridia bacterium]|nr:InlB B-repeat-containing protein [Clostridia bacterium]